MAGGVGGLLPLSADMVAHGARPTWIGYIGVDDVDATVAAVTADGGQVQMPAFDMPGVGRMAMVSDPQGAPFYLMRGASDGVSNAFSPTQTGHCGWNELHPSRQSEAFDFYRRHFGWADGGVMPMGPMGDYRFLNQGETMIGAVMPDRPGVHPHWKFYFRVPDVDAAMARIRAGGGTVTQEPNQVPGGDYAMSATDPAGVEFGLVGGRR
jgi:predicted enzyme related to lactoylglutathione lyase